MLARLDGNDEATDLALDEIRDADELRRALRYTVVLLAGEMSHDEWDHAGAVRWLEGSILRRLDALDEERIH
ncbi:MAG: hypothetical protein JWQ86_4197 [Mycobacterium sp.]|nr:hypothetical protein [Mycobacterium sp.]